MIGKLFRISVFGESHGKCIGILIEGCPPGIKVDEALIARDLSRRRPMPPLGTGRVEKDDFEILSGVFRGYTTGAPLSIVVWNRDIDSSKYGLYRRVPRPSHADYVARVKYKGFNDYRGGGMFSGRITVGFVIAGAIAKMFLNKQNIKVISHVTQIGSIKLERELSYDEVAENMGSGPIECGDLEKALEMARLVEKVRGERDSIGGVVEAIAIGLPVGLGDPPLEGLESEISKAIFSIPGVKAIEFGAGFKLASMRGSMANDQYTIRNGKVVTLSNNSGGILGGLSNGMPLRFRVVFKPPSSIPRVQKSIDLDSMEETTINVEGRFDPCIAVRAPPIVEAMLSIVLADHILRWLAWKA